MQHDGPEARRVKENGWRQGSILGDELVRLLGEQELLPRLECPGVWVVLSHDCDVTNPSFEAEPFVELVFGEIIGEASLDGNRQWGKNARLLQIQNSSDWEGAEYYQFSATQRIWVERRLLAEQKPSQKKLDFELISRLSRWVAKRYVRAAFPDEFVERTRTVVERIRKKAKRDGRLITGIYLLVSDEELTKDAVYEIVVFATMLDEMYDDSESRKVAAKLLSELDDAFDNCAGIRLRKSELRKESQLTLTELRFMKRWDFDDLTLRGETQASIPMPQE
ncbi:MAG: hypothetical protein U0795_19540 [Pirellulales bacterium]